MSRTVADSLKVATAGMRRRDVIDVRETPKPQPKLKPTVEQMVKSPEPRLCSERSADILIIGGDAEPVFCDRAVH